MDFPKHIMEEEFIMRLPVKSLMKFKCVSKDWNNFICDDRFRRNYQSSQHSKSNVPPTGYICQYGLCRCQPLIDKEFLYTSESHVAEEEVKSVLSYLHSFEVLAVAKGLLLLGNNIDTSILHIYDLVSKQHVILPRIHKDRPLIYKHTINFGISCVEEETTTKHATIHHRRFHYKFVYIEDIKQQPDSSLSIWIFSSKTGTWNQSIMKAKSNFLISMPDIARVIRGVFHWRCLYSSLIIAHNPDDLNGRTVLINILPEMRFFEFKFLVVTKDGYLQYTNMKKMNIEVWILDTGEQSYMDESIVDATKWVLTSSVSFWDIFSRFRDLEEKPFHYIFGVDPSNADILYLRIDFQIYAYNHLEKVIVFKCSQPVARGLAYVHFFEWPTWPSL